MKVWEVMEKLLQKPWTKMKVWYKGRTQTEVLNNTVNSSDSVRVLSTMIKSA